MKTFVGETMMQAMNQVRLAYGPDALILHTRSINRPGQPALVELTAAPPIEESTADAPADDPQKLRDRQLALEQQLAMLVEWVEQLETREPNAWRTLHEQLVDLGFHRSIADRCIDSFRKDGIAPDTLDNPRLRSRLLELLTRQISTRPHRDQTGPRIVVLVGPTGVGKTTLAAKLAAWAVRQENKRVVIVSTDQERVGADEQLSKVGELLKVEVETVRSDAQWQRLLLRHLQTDWIIVDTPGCATLSDRDEGLTIKEKNVQRLLVVDAHCSEAKLSALIGATTLDGFSGIVLTKLDEPGWKGQPASIALRTGLPVTWMCQNRSLHEGLTKPDGSQLARIALGMETWSTPSVGNVTSLDAMLDRLRGVGRRAPAVLVDEEETMPWKVMTVS